MAAIETKLDSRGTTFACDGGCGSAALGMMATPGGGTNFDTGGMDARRTYAAT